MYRRWSLAADTIKTEILDEGWSSTKRAFRQRYGNEALDASNLAIPFLGVVPREYPRIRQNLDAIERELTDGPLVWRRYLPDETDDGLEGRMEGAFTLLSFWLIGNLIYTGQHDRAFDYFNEVIATQGNHLGLFAEMYDKSIKRQLGNFPQAYSHIGLIHSALNLSGYIANTPTRRIHRTRKLSLRQAANVQGSEGQHLRDLLHVADAAELIGYGLRLRAAAGAVEQARDARRPQVACVVAGVGTGQHRSHAVGFPSAGHRPILPQHAVEDVLVLGQVEGLHDHGEHPVLRVGWHFYFVMEIGVVGLDPVESGFDVGLDRRGGHAGQEAHIHQHGAEVGDEVGPAQVVVPPPALTGVGKREIIAKNRPRHLWIPAYAGTTEWA